MTWARSAGLPVVALRHSIDLADDHVHDAIEQVVLVLDVAVERHGIDPELLPEPTHAQTLDAVAVGEVDGDLEHTRAAQRRPFRHRTRACFGRHVAHLLDESTP